MYEKKLVKLISEIKPADRQAAAAARRRWDSLAKPIDGMGLFEDIVVTIAAAQGRPDVDISRRVAVVMCADHGVVEEGVSQTGSAVTAAVAASIAAGQSTVNILASAAGTDVIAVDVGICADSSEAAEGVWNMRVKSGTDNIAKGAAMSREEAAQAVLAGMQVAERLKAQGYNIIVCGEMGIGNTTPTAAITSVLTGIDPDELTGRGAGLSCDGLEKKKAIVRKAIELNRPDPKDALDILSKIGGLEIAGMTGVFLGGALCGIPVIADVSVSSAAAVLAVKLCPFVSEYIVASNRGKEKTAAKLNDILGLKPVMCAEMALGEATGGVMLLPLLDVALSLYNNGTTFEEAGIKPYERFEE